MKSDTSQKPEVLFLGRGYAGHRTRFENLRRHAVADGRFELSSGLTTGWTEGGLIERAPIIPRGVKGRLRAIHQSASVAKMPRPDAIWTGVVETAVPFLWSQVGPLRRPLILDLDSTVEQLEGMSAHYWSRPAKRGIRLRVAEGLEKMVWQSTSLFTPWSEWAAGSLRRAGIPSERIRVMPPGVDLDAWTPHRTDADLDNRRLRALFVGGDFIRKGGDLLLELASGLSDKYEFDVVTREDVQPSGNVRVHRAEPNSEALRRLYSRADIFVMPSKAECFGIAVIEAMASGLPCIVGDVGGVGEIIRGPETGWLIEPNAQDLRRALVDAYARRSDLPTMGRVARLDAEARFDGASNDKTVLDLVQQQINEFQRIRN